MKNKLLIRHFCIRNLYTFLALAACFYVISFFSDCTEIARKCSVQEIRYTVYFLKISFYRSFSILYEIIPYILLLSNSFILSKMNSSEELTILKTNGLSIFQILTPFIVCATFISLFNLFIFHPFTINAAQKTSILEHVLLGESIDKHESKSNIWIEKKIDDENELLIYIKDITKTRLNSVNIYIMDSKHRFKTHTFAKNAIIKDGYWILSKVTETQKNQPLIRHEEKKFETNLTLEDIKLYYKNPITLDIFSIYHTAKLRESKGLPFSIFEFSLHFLLIKVIFTIIAALFPILSYFRHHRYSVKWLNILQITAFAFFLNFCTNSLRSFGLNSHFSPMITCWLPALFMLSIEIFLILRKESST